MKAIVHIGMHKTGTSSIQTSFHKKSPEGAVYLNHIGENLNAWARLMFEDANAVRQLNSLRNADDAEWTCPGFVPVF